MIATRYLVLVLTGFLLAFSSGGFHQLGRKRHYQHADKLVAIDENLLEDLGADFDVYGNIRAMPKLFDPEKFVVGIENERGEEMLCHVGNAEGLRYCCPLTYDIAHNDRRHFYHINKLYLPKDFTPTTVKRRWQHEVFNTIGPQEIDKFKFATQHQEFAYLSYLKEGLIYKIDVDLFLRFVVLPLLEREKIAIARSTWPHYGLDIDIEFLHQDLSSVLNLGELKKKKEPAHLLALMAKHIEKFYGRKNIFQCLRTIKWRPFHAEMMIIDQALIEKLLEHYKAVLTKNAPSETARAYQDERVTNFAYGDRWLW